MLKLDQIKGDLMCNKLGNCSVAIEHPGWDEAVGVTVKDSRFTFIEDWAKRYCDWFDYNDAWYEMQDVFHKYIQKALAKQGIKKGANNINIGKKSITVELVKGDDEHWYHDTFGENHRIDASYFINADEHINSYGAASLMSSVIDHEELLVDYLLYTDNLVAELKTQLRKAVICLKDTIEEYTFERHKLNDLGLQYLMNGCNELLKDYEVA